MLVVLRAGPTDPPLAERRVPDRVPEGGEALIEDFIAVGREQQSRSRQRLVQPGVVDGGRPAAWDGRASAVNRGIARARAKAT